MCNEKLFMLIRPELEELAVTDGLHVYIKTAPLIETICKKLGKNMTETSKGSKTL